MTRKIEVRLVVFDDGVAGGEVLQDRTLLREDRVEDLLSGGAAATLDVLAEFVDNVRHRRKEVTDYLKRLEASDAG